MAPHNFKDDNVFDFRLCEEIYYQEVDNEFRLPPSKTDNVFEMLCGDVINFTTKKLRTTDVFSQFQRQ